MDCIPAGRTAVVRHRHLLQEVAAVAVVQEVAGALAAPAEELEVAEVAAAAAVECPTIRIRIARLFARRIPQTRNPTNYLRLTAAAIALALLL